MNHVSSEAPEIDYNIFTYISTIPLFEMHVTVHQVLKFQSD